MGGVGGGVSPKTALSVGLKVDSEALPSDVRLQVWLAFGFLLVCLTNTVGLLLAKLFAQPSNLLVMDEPTNDLDVETLELLEELRESSQLIVITHQKRTMEAADILYGVTMGRDGVSQIVSRRLPREEVAVA